MITEFFNDFQVNVLIAVACLAIGVLSSDIAKAGVGWVIGKITGKK